jgi:hypothetical protein
MTSLAIQIDVPLVSGVKVTDDTLTVDLNDGRTISVPIEWFPRLLHGTSDERGDWRLIGGGEGIHWESLDEDISTAGLLAGLPSQESQRSLKRWLDARSAG